MKVYVDVIIILNLIYDFLILTSVSILLKRNASLKRLSLGALYGISTIITLFISLDKWVLLSLKLVTSISMVIISFGPKRLLENIFYFYIITIIIGGSQYMVKGDDYTINIVTMMILSPIVLILYINSLKKYKLELTKHYNVIIIDKNIAYTKIGYMDTGNTLKDPITKLPVILVSNTLIFNSNIYFYVPYQVLNNSSILKCVKVDKVLIDNKEVKCLLGLASPEIFKDGIEVILNECIRENITC